MKSSIPSVFGLHQLRRATWLFFALWTLAVGVSLAWKEWLVRNAIVQAATQAARTSCDKELHYLLNPIYMTRQVHATKAQADDMLGHITYLKPLRPENTPDAWEAAALRAFNQGRTEMTSLELLQGRQQLRFMKPIVTVAACLECHTDQGYEVGKNSGGISVTVPLDPFQALAQAQFWHTAGVHAGLWTLGTIGIFLASGQIRRRLDQQLRAEEALRESEERFRIMFEMASIGMAQADPQSGQWLRVNRKMCAITGYSAAEMLQMRVPEITHPEDRQKDWEAFQRVVRGEAPDYRLEKRYVRKDGTITWVNVNMTVVRSAVGQPTHTLATIEDITERKASEAEREKLLQDLMSAQAGVKSLSGLLPICSSCKQIRDDKGYWSQVESYISEHSEASFTHGLCPSCVKIYFPGTKVADD